MSVAATVTNEFVVVALWKLEYHSANTLSLIEASEADLEATDTRRFWWVVYCQDTTKGNLRKGEERRTFFLVDSQLLPLEVLRIG